MPTRPQVRNLRISIENTRSRAQVYSRRRLRLAHLPMPKLPVVPVCRIPSGKSPLAPSGKSERCFPPSRAQWRGVSRSSWTVERGMRWPHRVAVRVSRADERLGADGQDVWSRHPDAGVLVGDDADDGGNKARSPGRARSSRKSIAQGRPVVRPILWFLPPAFFSQAGHGCGLHPAFPAPSSFEGVPISKARTRQRAARRRSRACRTEMTRPAMAPPWKR